MAMPRMPLLTEARFEAIMRGDPECDCHLHMGPGKHDTANHTGADLARIEFDARRAVEREALELAHLAAEEQRKLRQEAALEAARRDHLTPIGGPQLVAFADGLRPNSKKATFTCGGRIPIALSPSRDSTGNMTPTTAGKTQDQTILTKPVTIRWGQNKQGRVLEIPVPSTDAAQDLQDLIDACAPASFGRGGKDVFDETYRRAGALEHFTTDFSPYEAGIIDVVAQLLLPSIAGASEERGLRAEMYKLNVYSGPSGMFKSHVDTPRSETQIGSLVVCLPVDFQGGALAIRHGGHQVLHDWSSEVNETNPAIQWAAVYSDCEHEVLEVTAGNRITLTYNFFLAHSNGHLAGKPLRQLPGSLPLSQQLQSLLENDTFMPEGGYLGFNLTHAYPHTSASVYSLIPQMLKGQDVAMYEAISAGGLIAALATMSAGSDILGRLDALQEQLQREGNLSAGANLPISNWLEPFSWDADLQQQEAEETECWDDSDNSVFENEVRVPRKNIVWLNAGNDSREVSHACVTYGNEAEFWVNHTTAVIIAKVPNLEARVVKESGKEEKDGMTRG